jgi:hypothetical protein
MPLKVTKHDELAHPNYFTIDLSYEYIASASRLDLCEGRKVGALVRGVFFPVFECAMLQEGDQAIHITCCGAPNTNCVH